MSDITIGGSISTTGVSILGNAAVIFTTDANHTLSVAEYTNNFLNVTSSLSLTLTRNLIGPLVPGQSFVIQNNTTGGQSIQIIGSSGTGVTISNGLTLSVICDGTNYLPNGGGSGDFIAGGDLSGTSSSQTVIAIQNNPVDAQILGSDQDGYVLAWDNTDGYWKGSPAASGFIAGGDLSGDALTQTVIGIQGIAVSSTTPQDGYVLTATSSTTADWAPSSSESDFTAGGDLSGTPTNQTVIAIQNNPVNAQILGSEQDGYVLAWDNTDGYWTGTQTSPGFTASGDLSGTPTSQTVIGIQSVSISSVPPSDGYILTATSSTTADWEVLPISFTAGGDLSGNGESQTVVGFYNNPLASTAPTNSAVYVWDSTIFDLRQLTADDIAPGFSITGFSGGSTVEIGVTVTDPSFTASYSSTPASAHITNTDGTDSPLALSNPYTSGTVVGAFHHTSATSVTFTLTAISTTTKTANTSISYEARSFGGIGSAGASSSVTASGNNAVLSTGDTINSVGLHSSDVGQTYGPFSPSGQKIYLMLIGGSHTFMSGAFSFPFNSPTPVSFTNQHGAVVNMFLYESTNTLSATYPILVVS